MKKIRINALLFLILISAFVLSISNLNKTSLMPTEKEVIEQSLSPETTRSRYPLTSAWIANGFPVTKDTNKQDFRSICSDNAGGVIIAYQDNRTGDINNQTVLVQRISSSGKKLWNTDGVALCTNTCCSCPYPKICSDGSGGAIVVWFDYRHGNGDIYAQKIDSSGTPQWTENGNPVCLNDSMNSIPQIISDGSGGAIIVWSDWRKGNEDIYAQRIDSNGERQWYEYFGDKDGAPVCKDPNDQYWPEISIDENGGSIIVWQDERTGSDNISLYAQRIGHNGIIQWSTEQVICADTYYAFPRYLICPDDDEGSIIVWSDNRSGNLDIYAQRINITGDIQWTENGIGVCIKGDDQNLESIDIDGYGGAIIAMKDVPSDDNGDIYSQRLNSTGDSQWTPNGQAISTDIGEQYQAEIANDGNGGAYISWEDEAGGNDDIWGQYVNSSGIPQWTINGIPICEADNRQDDIEMISDGAGNVITLWEDDRISSGAADIYASKLGPNGIVITPTPLLSDGDGNGKKKKKEEIIPGYDLYFILILAGFTSIMVYLKMKKKISK